MRSGAAAGGSGEEKPGGLAQTLRLAAGVLAAVALISCHPLINPADPRSHTYIGVPVTGDDGTAPAPEPVLPEVLRWESVVDHNGRPMPLEITPETAGAPTFIEPREPNPRIWITLADSFTWEDADGAHVWYAAADPAGTLYYGREEIDERREDRRLLVLYPDQPIQDEWMVRLRLIDRNGVTRGECLLGRLIGDVNGDGTVTAPDDGIEVDNLTGFTVDLSNPATVRADLDATGVVEGFAGNDRTIVNDRSGNALTATIPTFWD